MSSNKKWWFGGLGFVLGGPIGGLIGFVIGSGLDSLVGNISSSASFPSSRATQGDIQMSILILIACVIKADGKVLKSEIDYVKRFLKANYGENALEALHILKGLLQQEFDIHAVSEQIGQHVNYSTRLALLHTLVDIANADLDFVQSEYDILRKISFYIGIKEEDFLSLCAIYQPDKNSNWAYDILEIPSTATDEEVKRAYRRMSMKYHPDKVTNGGDEMKKKANEKFIAVHNAYDYIKKQRKLK